MNQLILTINKIQKSSSKYNFPVVELPQIVVVGSQSSGKSSVMERIIGHDILPKAATVATRCPIILQLIYSAEMCNDVKAIFMDTTMPVYGIDNISEALQAKTSTIGKSKEAISSEPIILELYSSTHPTLTLIDLPGIIKNDGELPKGSTLKIVNLTEKYVKASNSIILAISPANVDLANSDAIHVSKKYDPEGKRTVNVITKIDLMDRGTNITDILKSTLLANGIFHPICVVNRSQESVTKKLTIQDSNEYERQFIDSKRPDIYGDHGIKFLVTTLVHKLEVDILKNLPEIIKSNDKRIECLESELKSEAETIEEKDIYINQTLSTFTTEYRKMITGERESYPDTIVGGAKISSVLYEDYEKEIRNFQIKRRHQDSILILLRNTAGNKKMSYSIEKAFACIIREEVEKFKSASLRCNDLVRDHLSDFVQDIITEFKLDKYFYLSDKIAKDMKIFINIKHEVTKKIIDDIIRGEKEDIFCLRPNTIMFETLDAKYKKRLSELKETNFENIISKVSKDLTVPLSPQIRRILVNAFNSKCLSILKDSVATFQEEQVERSGTDSLPSKASMTRPSQIIPIMLSDMMNKVSKNNNDWKAMIDFFSKEKQFPTMINDMQIQSMKSNDVGANENDPNVLVLEDMVAEYFKVIQENMIRNVPKWIQTVFVKDLLTEIDSAFHCIRRETDLNDIFDKTKEELDKIQNKRKELKELRDISEELKSLRQLQVRK